MKKFLKKLFRLLLNRNKVKAVEQESLSTSKEILDEPNGNRRIVPVSSEKKTVQPQYCLSPAQVNAKNKRRDRNKAANKSRKQNHK